MQKHLRSVVLPALLLLAILTFLTASAQTAQGIIRPGLRVSQVSTLDASPAEEEAALAMWTRDAVAAASPMPFSTNVVEAVSPGTAIERLSLAPAPPPVPARAPDPGVDDVARAEFPQDWQAAVEEIALPLDELSPTAVEGTAGVYSSYYVNYYTQMHTQFPYRAIGKLTFSVPGGSGACTASVVSPNNIIVTAAHCVYDTENNRWYSNWAFTPAYRNGSAPYGTFPWRSARVLNKWIDATGIVRRYDVALIQLGNNSAGRPVTYYTGYLGRSWGYGYKIHEHTFGYATNLSSGRYSYVCAAESAYGGTNVLRMGCNMQFGSSGGPWIRKFVPYASGANNYVTSVVSGPAGTETFAGARFNSINITPLCNQGDWGC